MVFLSVNSLLIWNMTFGMATHGKDISAADKAPNSAHSVVFSQNRTELMGHLQKVDFQQLGI